MLSRQCLVSRQSWHTFWMSWSCELVSRSWSWRRCLEHQLRQFNLLYTFRILLSKCVTYLLVMNNNDELCYSWYITALISNSMMLTLCLCLGASVSVLVLVLVLWLMFCWQHWLILYWLTGDIRKPAVLFAATWLDGSLQERWLRQVVDSVPILLVTLSTNV